MNEKREAEKLKNSQENETLLAKLVRGEIAKNVELKKMPKFGISLNAEAPAVPRKKLRVSAALRPLKCNVYLAKEILESKDSAVVRSALREGFLDPEAKEKSFQNLMKFNTEENFTAIEKSVERIKEAYKVKKALKKRI